VEATTKPTGYLDLYRLGPSSAVVLYFFTILITALYPGSVTSMLYYLAIAYGVVVYYFMKRSVGMHFLLILAFGAGVLSTMNTVLIGNQTVVRTLVLVLSFFVAALMLDEHVDERAYLVAVYIEGAVVLLKTVLHGSSAAIYDGISNNYVSVHLLAPAVLYYGLLDARGKKIPLIPAVVIWMLCFLSGGRGGLLSGTILLAGVILRLYLGNERTRRERVQLGILLAAVMIPALFVLVQAVLNSGWSFYVVQRFLDKGMDGGGRIGGWIEYIDSLMGSLKYFLLGVDLDTQVWIQKYSGNLHNSFLFVHAYLGIIGFAVLIALIIRATVRAVQYKKGIYLCCIITFCFRGMTDHVFGGNRFSAVMIALLLITEVFRERPKEKQFYMMLRGVRK